MSHITHYLKDVATLECQIYTQNTLLDQLSNRINSLGYPSAYVKPEYETWRPDIGDIFKFSLIAAVWGAIIAGIIAMVSSGDVAGAGILAFLIVFVVAAVLRLALYDYGGYLSGKKRHEQELANYEAMVQEDAKRVEHELVLRGKLVQQWQDVKAEHDNTKCALDALYAVNIIHPKYRHLVAITSFYDYFDTGLCSRFTGHGGAYAVYEENLRFKRIEDQLDVIISKLDDIIANQRYIADLMREANFTLSRIEAANASMLNSVHRIEENSELIAYNTRCSAQSNAVMEHIMVYQMLKQD